MQALDAMNNPGAHDFIINVHAEPTPANPECVICSGEQDYHDDPFASDLESITDSRVSLADAQT